MDKTPYEVAQAWLKGEIVLDSLAEEQELVAKAYIDACEKLSHCSCLENQPGYCGH